MAEPLLANPDPDAPALVGGEYEAPAFQTVEQPSGERTVENVPRATMVQPAPLPSDFGVFHDLVPQDRPQVGGVDFGVFSDLIPKPPPSITPASDAVVSASKDIIGGPQVFSPEEEKAAVMNAPDWAQALARPAVSAGKLLAGQIPTSTEQLTSMVPMLTGTGTRGLGGFVGEAAKAGVSLAANMKATTTTEPFTQEWWDNVMPVAMAGLQAAGIGLHELPMRVGKPPVQVPPVQTEVLPTGPPVQARAVEPAAAMRPPPETAAEPAPAVEPIIQAEPAPPAAAAPAVAGPALVDAQGKVIVQGEIGDTHADLMKRAMGTPQEEAAVDALAKDEQHAFVDDAGNVLNREEAAKTAKAAGQVEEGTTRLQSEQLKPVEEPAPVAEPAPEAITPPAEEAKYMHPSERPEVPKITEVPPERVPPEPESNDWTTDTEPIEKQAGKLRLKADSEGGFVDLSGVADLGRRIYERGVDFARWSAEMIRHLGEKIKPHLQAVWNSFTGKNLLPGRGESGAIGGIGIRRRSELDALTGKRSAKLQSSTATVERIEKEFRKTARTPRVENAMSAWAEAKGDLGVLKQQEQLAKGKMFKQAVQDAQKLSPEQQALALKGRQTFDVLGARLQHYGVLDQLRQDYIPHMFDVGQKFTGLGGSKLVSKFKFAKAAKYQSFFEADQAGLKPKTMEQGKLLGVYKEHADRVIADRQFVQGVQGARSREGEPLVIPRGQARIIGDDPQGKAVLVNSHSFKTATDAKGNPVDQLKYKVDPEQPALRKWLWAGKDTQGRPIFMQDDLAIHPELAKRLKAMTGRSLIRQFYEEPSAGGLTAIPKAIIKHLDTAQSVMKREMFGLLAPFHQVQEGTHAVGHLVNPFFRPKQMMTKLTPAMMDAAEHGLILRSERGGAAAAMEGVGGKGQFLSKMTRKYGGPAGRAVANVLDGYQDFLFEHYIPALKYKTYEHMVDRNTKRYKKELAKGEVTSSDIKMLSAQQSNAAYGKLNLALLDRSPTLQHALQALLIAPDFLEARGKFVGQAAKQLVGSKAGREQLRAIAVLVMAQAGTAAVISQVIGGEWDPKRPFEVNKGNRTYFLRSVPEDFARLAFQGTDKRREFISARLNPYLNAAIQTFVTGRNYRGEKITTGETAWELVNNYIPIMARSFPGIKELTQTSRDSPISPWERFAGSAGIKVSRTSPITKTYQAAHDWKEAQGMPRDTGTYPVSKYQQMRYALEDNDQEKAAAEFQKLLATQPDRKKVLAGFHESLMHPFTESKAMDKKFRDSLDESARANYDAAIDRRKEIMRRFNEMKAR